MLKNIFSSSKEVIIERIKSPLFFVFGLLWFIFNWKAPLILFLGKGSVEDKIISIESIVTLQSSIVYPFITTVFYIGIYPFIAYYIFKLHNSIAKRKELIKIQNECEVLEAEKKRTKLKLRVQDYQYQSEIRLERDKLDHQYRLAERKYALGMKKLEYQVKSKEVGKSSHGSSGKRLNGEFSDDRNVIRAVIPKTHNNATA
jgi:hypothetical protein